MTPADAISMLDRQLAEHGETVSLRHVTTGGAVSATDTLRAFVRGYRPEELVNGLKQGDVKVTLSPTGLSSDPQQADQLVIGSSRVVTIAAVETIRLADVVVRHNVQARG